MGAVVQKLQIVLLSEITTELAVRAYYRDCNQGLAIKGLQPRDCNPWVNLRSRLNRKTDLRLCFS